jgi:hypothetical protein
MSLTVYELYNQIDKKKNSRSKSFEKVLDICFNKIRVATEKEHLRLCFDVPEYVFGLPVYNLSHCTKFIMENLSKNGFLVKYFFPKTLYISWDLDELNDIKTNVKSESNLLLKEESFTNRNLLAPSSSSLTNRDRLLLSTNDAKKIDFKNSNDRSIFENKKSKPNGKFTLTLD